MRIGICDDESIVRGQIARSCIKFAKEEGVYVDIVEFTNGQEVFRHSSYIDVLFLDIEMNGTNGIDVMRKLVANDHVFRIVFVSSHDEMVMDVFGLKTLAFVTKPVTFEKLSKWLKVVSIELEKDFIVELEEVKEKKYIKASQIMYVESKGNYSGVVTKENILITRRTMHKWEDILNRGDFIRVHKSYIVNMEYIENINNDVMLKDGKSIAMGRSYKRNILEEYNKFVLKKMRDRR